MQNGQHVRCGLPPVCQEGCWHAPKSYANLHLSMTVHLCLPCSGSGSRKQHSRRLSHRTGGRTPAAARQKISRSAAMAPCTACAVLIGVQPVALPLCHEQCDFAAGMCSCSSAAGMWVRGSGAAVPLELRRDPSRSQPSVLVCVPAGAVSARGHRVPRAAGAGQPRVGGAAGVRRDRAAAGDAGGAGAAGRPPPSRGAPWAATTVIPYQATT